MNINSKQLSSVHNRRRAKMLKKLQDLQFRT